MFVHLVKHDITLAYSISIIITLIMFAVSVAGILLLQPYLSTVSLYTFHSTL